MLTLQTMSGSVGAERRNGTSQSRYQGYTTGAQPSDSAMGHAQSSDEPSGCLTLKYAAYLKTPAGRLRSELAWENVRRFLPPDASKQRALDVGGGTGAASVQLAQMGCEVVLLDASEEMLRIARQQAEAGSTAQRIFFCHAYARQLPELCGAESFDIVVCHNLLEYAENPFTTVHDIAHVLRQDAVLSLLVRNRMGEVLKAAIKSGNWKLATANLTSETVVDSLFGEPVCVFAVAEVLDLLARADLEVVAEHGVRVFFDYLVLEKLTDEAYEPAADDLNQICDYINEHDSAVTACRVALSIYERVSTLVELP